MSNRLQMKCKLEFSDIKIERLCKLYTPYMFVRTASNVSFDCSYITCKYWVGHPLALDTASTCLGIEKIKYEHCLMDLKMKCKLEFSDIEI